MEYDVFISCKSEDYKYAEEIYNFLKENGFNTFLANKELRQMGDSEYRRAISQALKSTYHLIVFASNAEYIDSTWVYYEWDWFLVAKIKGKKQGQLLSILKDVDIDDVNADLWKYESKTFENYKESLLAYIETPAYLQRKKEAEEKARLAEEKRKQEKEAALRREKILKEIKEETTDYERHSSNLDSLALKIIEKKKVVGCIEKLCPVCTTVHPIGETFCSKCGFTFSPIFEENPSINDTQLFVHQGLWRTVKKAENDKEQFNQRFIELKDKIQKVSVERDNLKKIQSEFQIKIKELSDLLTFKESEIKKNISQAETEKKCLNRKVQSLESEVRTKNRELDIVNNKLRISNEEKDKIVQEAESKINELQSQIKLIKEKYNTAQIEIEKAKKPQVIQSTQKRSTPIKLYKSNLTESIIKCCKKPLGSIFGTDRLVNIGFDENKFRELVQETYAITFGKYDFASCKTFDDVKKIVARKANIKLD